ncbi:AMP-binding protein [Portibacter lacus]|uniref:Long-chain-fatty-acid--CoA ligase n=1 Tax=Portibacter lacus TaxID=1099794 RepID=A0AA37SQA0_9BACT|nr:AMP-binding protein [Portibacter lacus]GLR17734.1 long-chain-fatty-acid--CoA ligase [Portibacter lacus]
MAEERPWIKNYPSGVPANIDPNQYNTINEFAADCFKKYKNQKAFECMGKAITYGELDKMSTNFGAYLHSRGLEPGDKIALMMPNLLQFPIAFFGALKAGLIVVNTNPLYTAREMKHQFTDSKVSAIVIVENFASNLEKIIGDTNIKTIITTTIGEMLGMKGHIVNFVVKSVKKMVPKFELQNTVKFKDALSQGKKFVIKDFNSDHDTVILHQYTGGTTGVSKGAMLTNKNMIANMLQIKAWLGEHVPEGAVSLSPLPLYHIFACTVNCLSMMACGAHNVLVTNARDLPSVIKEFKNHDVALFTGLNTLFNALLNHKDFASAGFEHLKITVGGGMAVQTAVAEKWEKVTGCRLSEGYGMTESSPVVTINPIDGTARLGTIGMPVSSTDVRILGEDGTVQPVGGIGEIQVQGPQVMKGYYNRPDETVKTIVDGWLCTGDIGSMDEDGFFRIVDRKKDMILVSGFNVYPNEIEGILAAHPKILESAAIGIPDEKSGEVVKIFVVKKDKSLTEDEIKAYCRENMTGYKIPKVIEFRDELPKSNVGKILRRELRDEKKS